MTDGCAYRSGTGALALAAAAVISLQIGLARQGADAGQPSSVPPPSTAPGQPAAGAEVQPGVPPAPLPREVGFSVDLGVLHAFSAEVEGGGNVAVTRAGGWLGIDVPIADYHLLTLEMSSEFSFYSFDNAVGLDPADGDPFGTTEEFRLGARLFIRQAVRWGWFVAGDITSAGEPGAEFSDTLTGGGYGGVRYWFSEGFSLSAGLAARTRLEESAYVTPFVSIDWKINDRWAVRTSQHVLERGLNVALLYAPSPSLAFSLSGGYQPREYRLDRDGFNPEGSVSDNRLPIELGVAWKATPGLTVHGGLGVYLWQEFTVRDGAGNEIAQRETDSQPFATVGVEFKF